MNYTGKNYWALILGGSSGFGLATAKKLSSLGMNICVVHRDRKGSLPRIEEEFASIKKNGVSFVSVNTNALTEEGRSEILGALSSSMGEKGRVRLLLHSIALGNLKLLVPEPPALKSGSKTACEALSRKLGIPLENVVSSVQELFREGIPEMETLATPPEYGEGLFLEDEDVAQTIYAMGTSLLTWVRILHDKKYFAADARVISMSSEGNQIAWRAYGAVSAAKSALEAVSRSIALEYAPCGIRCNVIQAGVTDTPALRMIPGNDHLMAKMKIRNPFRRLTRPEDVGDFVALLCADESAWVNGEVIRVDGGEHIAG